MALHRLKRFAEVGSALCRLSVGASLMRATIGPLIAAAQELRGSGTFAFADEAPSGGEILKMFEAGG